MLVNLKEIIGMAEKGGYCIPAFNVYNVECVMGVIEAAEDLGANRFQVFYKVVLPLSLPGIISGITMVFLPALTSFYISDFFSGGQFMLIGNVIEKNFKNPIGRNFGSSLSIILMAFAFLSMHVMKIFNKSNRQMDMF